MVPAARPTRSVLYIPASRASAVDKARNLPTDAIIFDLEDAVAVDQKVAAREALNEALAAGGYGRRTLLVRVNGLDTPWGAADIAAFADAKIDGLLVPKVEVPEDLDAVLKISDTHPLWAMMETARGVLCAGQIADHASVAGLVVGTNDLLNELGAQHQDGRAGVQTCLQLCLLAARAAGIACVDGVFNAFRDDDGLRAECLQGRNLGYDGKTLIHPAQLAIANEVFAPKPTEIDLAKRQIAAFEEAEAEGRGVAVLDGRIVENLHVFAAKATLAKAVAIGEMEE